MNTLAYPSDTKNLELADVLIRPEIDHITSTDFDSLNSLVESGYRSCQKYWGKIQPYADNICKSPDFLENAINKLNNT